MKTLKTLIIATVTALSWSSFSTELPDWYVRSLEKSNYLPIIVREPDGYRQKAIEKTLVSKRLFECRPATDEDRNNYEERKTFEGVFIELSPGAYAGYHIRYCEPSEVKAEREEQRRRQSERHRAQEMSCLSDPRLVGCP